jgi:hypothetical protein
MTTFRDEPNASLLLPHRTSAAIFLGVLSALQTRRDFMLEQSPSTLTRTQPSAPKPGAEGTRARWSAKRSATFWRYQGLPQTVG